MAGGMVIGRSVAADGMSAPADEALPDWTEQFDREVAHQPTQTLSLSKTR